MVQNSGNLAAEIAQRSTRRLIIFLTIVGLFLFLFIFVIFLFNAGYREGTEFSPDDFSHREFSYNKDPIFGYVLRGRQYSSITPPLEKSLISDGLITPQSNNPKKWVLTSFSRSSDGLIASDCDARFLTEYLDKTDESYTNVWTTWNIDCPGPAKIFWPVIAQLARDDLYLKIPDVMDFALDWKKDDPVAFKEQFDIVVADAYYEMALLDLQLTRTELAKSRLEKSIKFEPSDKAKTLLSSLK